MIKDIVVNLGLGSSDPTVDYAVSMAEIFEAHLLAIAVSYDPIIPGTVMGGIPPEIIEGQRREVGQKSARGDSPLRAGGKTGRHFERNTYD